MKKTTILILMCMFVHISISQTSRGIDFREMDYDSIELVENSSPQNLPQQLQILNPSLTVATDQSSLEIASPIFQQLRLQIFEYLEDSVIWEQTLWVFPGNQKIPLYLYELVEGEYTLAICREEEVVYRYFAVEE